jgi:hypothetical protein
MSVSEKPAPEQAAPPAQPAPAQVEADIPVPPTAAETTEILVTGSGTVLRGGGATFDIGRILCAPTRCLGPARNEIPEGGLDPPRNTCELKPNLFGSTK